MKIKNIIILHQLSSFYYGKSNFFTKILNMYLFFSLFDPQEKNFLIKSSEDLLKDRLERFS